MFFAAILPQFVDTSLGHVPVQMLILGLVFVADRDGGRQHVGPRRRNGARAARLPRPAGLNAIGGASGVVLVGLGVGLAVTGRKP